ncbi:MAG: hypothetical protein NDJ92_10010 [Thermoanaerobaculia bacterium]|nr:hypothetical protein [Thermoanaerobaculia bacterium]
MRRFLIVLVLVLTAAGAGAQLRVSDVLLTDGGTLFTVDIVKASELETEDGTTLDTASNGVLRLRIQNGDKLETIAVPGSLTGGYHVEPSLAFDEADGRLYIFWQRIPGLGASELLFASYKDGDWSEVSTFDNGIWRIRFNLKVTITRFAERTREDGTKEQKPALIAHAIWWEQLGQRESARYAMLELDHGDVRSIQVHELTDFVTSRTPEPYVLPDDYDRNVFRTPFVFNAADGDSIDVLFADWYTNRYQLVTIRPIEDEKNGVLHIPIGVTTGEFGPMPIRARDTSAPLVAMRPNPSTGTIVVYSGNDESIEYVALRSGRWSSSSSLKLNSAMTLDIALEGLRSVAGRR